MNNLITIFIFNQNSNLVLNDFQNRIVIGIISLIGGLIGYLFKRSKDKSAAGFLWTHPTSLPVIAMAVGMLWLGVCIPFYLHYKSEYSRLQAEYDSQQYHLVEGIVHVMHTQPASGHDTGDIIQIGNVELQVDAFVETFGYRETIMHGGALTEGTYARVYYDYNPTNGDPLPYTILRVDVKK